MAVRGNAKFIEGGQCRRQRDHAAQNPVARAPEFIGGEAMAGFEVAGDVLTLRYQSILSAAAASPPTAGSSLTLRRVE